MTDGEVERMAEAVAKGIERARLQAWVNEAHAAAYPPNPSWIEVTIGLLLIAGFLWWIA